MDWTLEVVILPVSDIDRAIAFYRDRIGFELDHATTNRGPSRSSRSAPEKPLIPLEHRGHFGA